MRPSTGGQELECTWQEVEGEGNSSQVGANYSFILITAHCSKGQEKDMGLNLRCSAQENCRGNSVKNNWTPQNFHNQSDI